MEVDDMIDKIMWVQHFLAAQGQKVKLAEVL